MPISLSSPSTDDDPLVKVLMSLLARNGPQPTPAPAPPAPAPAPAPQPAQAAQAAPSGDDPSLTQTVMSMLSGAGDRMNDLGSAVRYGTFPETKMKKMQQGDIPGMPPMYIPGDKTLNGAMNPEAERYASNYLAAKKWGLIPATAFNAIALDDISDPLSAKNLAKKKVGLDAARLGDAGGWQTNLVDALSSVFGQKGQ
jgi:hypothetical protein